MDIILKYGGDARSLSTWDKHLITPVFKLVQQTRERYYTGPFSYEYVDRFNTYYRVTFFIGLTNKDDSIDFDKSRSIQSKIGNKNYTLIFNRINRNKEKLYIIGTAEVSERYMMTVFDELAMNSSAHISFSVPLKDGKTCSIVYSAKELKELSEGATYFFRSQ